MIIAIVSFGCGLFFGSGQHKIFMRAFIDAYRKERAKK